FFFQTVLVLFGFGARYGAGSGCGLSSFERTSRSLRMRGDIGTRSAAITFRSRAISAAGRHRRVQRWASTKAPTAGCSVPPLSTALTTTLDISQKAGRAEAPQSSVRPVIFAF